MNDKLLVKVRVSTGFAGGVHRDDHHIDREYWESMNKDQQEAYLDECCQTAISNYIEANASVVECNEDDEDD